MLVLMLCTLVRLLQFELITNLKTREMRHILAFQYLVHVMQAVNP